MERTYDLLGARWRIACTDERTARRLEPLLAPFGSDAASGASPAAEVTIAPSDRATEVVLTMPGERDIGPRSSLMARLVARLTAAAIEGFPGFAVHAGVIASDGGAVVLAAPSGVGKSTLTAACLLQGFDYVSDEALCVATGTVAAIPFPKPIALGGASAALLDLRRARLDTKDLLPPALLGARIATAPVPVAHVVALERTGGGRSRPQELPRSATVATLLGMSFNAHRDQVGALETTTSIARAARSWRLDVGDPRAAARALYDLATERAEP